MKEPGGHTSRSASQRKALPKPDKAKAGGSDNGVAHALTVNCEDGTAEHLHYLEPKKSSVEQIFPSSVDAVREVVAAIGNRRIDAVGGVCDGAEDLVPGRPLAASPVVCPHPPQQ